MQPSRSLRPSTKPATPQQQADADSAENARIGAMASWRAEWRTGLYAALELALAIHRRDFDSAEAAFAHLHLLFRPARP